MNKETKQQLPLAGVFGAVTVVGIIFFVLGIYVSDTTLGTKISEKLNNVATQETADNNLPEDLEYADVERVYDVLRSKFYGDLTEEQLIEGLKAGLADATGDPFTVYLDAEAVREFDISLNNEFSGIGAEIAVKNDQLQIVAPLPNTPAEKSGLRAGDPIIKINSEPTEDITVEEAVTQIRGEAGTEVVLTIVRDGELKEIKITRAQIDVPNASGKVLDGNIGYIDLTTFGDDSVAETKNLAQDFKNKNVKGVVLDLRNNSGGLLEAAVDIAGLWLDSKVTVEQKGNGRNSGQLVTRPGAILEGVPTVILINKGSASASEIVAGAMKDYGVATIVGEQSFGKGSVQSLERLANGAKLKVTIARWFTPNGYSIDQEGVAPDHIIELTTEDFNNNRDPQLDKALRLLK